MLTRFIVGLSALVALVSLGRLLGEEATSSVSVTESGLLSTPDGQAFAAGESVLIDTSTVTVFDTPTVGLRWLNPFFFFSTVTVDLQLTAPQCNPENIQLVVERSSSINTLAKVLPGDGLTKILHYLSWIIPSVRECSLEIVHSDDPIQKAQGTYCVAKSSDATILRCAADCSCQLSVPAYPEPTIAAVSFKAKNEREQDTAFTVKSITFPWLQRHNFRLVAAFVIGMLCFLYAGPLAENTVFQFIVSFILGIGVLSVGLAYLVVATIEHIPGFAPIRRMKSFGGAVGTLGVGSILWSALDYMNMNPFVWTDEDPTILIPVTGWDNAFDTGIPTKAVFLFAFGIIGVIFRRWYGLFTKIEVTQAADQAQAVGDDDATYLVVMTKKDGVSLRALKFITTWSGLLVALWSWPDLTVLLAYSLAAQLTYYLYLRAEHLSHIPSEAARRGMHGGFRPAEALQIVGGRGRRGDWMSADELTEGYDAPDLHWNQDAEGEAYSLDCLSELKAEYERKPELIARLPVAVQQRVRDWMDGGSHLASIEQDADDKPGCCVRIFGAKCRKFLLSILVLVAIVTLAQFVL